MANIPPVRGATTAQAALINGALQRGEDISGTIISRGATSAQLAALVPRLNELVINTDLNTLVRGNGATLGGLSLIPNLDSPASVIIGPNGGTLIANGANLAAGYAAAKALAPYGNAKAALNKAWLGILPGIYDLRSAGSGITFDTDWLNVIGLGRRPEDVVILVDSAVNRILTQTADNVLLANFTVYSASNTAGFAFNGNGAHSFTNTVHDSLLFTGAGANSIACHSFANLLSNNFGGTYRRCRSTQTRMYGGLTDGWTCNAIFEDCEAYVGSLGCSVSNVTFVTFTGRHTRCRLLVGGALGSITCTNGAVIEFGWYKTGNTAQRIFKVTGNTTPGPFFRRNTIISGATSFAIAGKEAGAVCVALFNDMPANGVDGTNITNAGGLTAAQAFNIESASVTG